MCSLLGEDRRGFVGTNLSPSSSIRWSNPMEDKHSRNADKLCKFSNGERPIERLISNQEVVSATTVAYGSNPALGSIFGWHTRSSCSVGSSPTPTASSRPESGSAVINKSATKTKRRCVIAHVSARQRSSIDSGSIPEQAANFGWVAQLRYRALPVKRERSKVQVLPRPPIFMARSSTL